MEDLFNGTELNDTELEQVVGGNASGGSALNAIGGAVSGLLNADNGNAYGGQKASARQKASGFFAGNFFAPINVPGTHGTGIGSTI